jgi:hypothetical protein
MITVFKLICILACGVVLGVGMSAQTAWAEDDGMNSSRSTPRIGGQDGQPYDHATHKDGLTQTKGRQDRHPGERIGGQDGRPYDHEKHEYEPDHAKGRIGGQSGESSGLIQLE